MPWSGVRTFLFVEALLRGTRKGLEGLGGLRNREERTVFHRGMEQSTGAIAYPRKARPPTAS